MKLKVIGPNQTEVEITDGVVLFSYNTPVAAKIAGCYYRTEVNHSATTNKHIRAWLNGNIAEETTQEFMNRL